MTNEEKEKELGIKYQTPCHGVGDCEFEASQAALEMARWKDEQFNMIIEKIIDLFDKYPSNAVFSKNNIIEMFKTLKIAMEE